MRRASGSQVGVSLQGPKAGERDSCSVYGTGRIHCEQSRSVNYRRAINRAETDPRVSQEHLTLSSPQMGLDVGNGLLPGVWDAESPSSLSPEGPHQPVPSAWPILALAHFCLCLFALSNHVQCQYGKSGRCSHVHLPCVLCPGLAVSSLAPGPIWLSCREGRSPVGSQIALHCLGPQPSWESCNLSWTSRWGGLRQGRWGSPSVGPAWVMPWVRKALLSSQHTLGVRPWLAAQGLAFCCRNGGRLLALGEPLRSGQVILGHCL